MVSISFDAHELDELADDLFAVPAKVEAKSIMVVAKVARLTERNAQRFVPELTGALHRGITSHSHGLSAEISASSLAGGADREYSDYVEYGTSDTRPQPYMRPAADLAYEPLLDGLGDAGEHIL